MEHDDIVDASMYAVKGMSLGFEVTPEQANQIDRWTVPAAVSTNRIINPRMATWDGSIGSGSIRNKGKPVDIRPFEAEPTEAMLVDKSSPYNIDPETLVNLWAVRFGKEWVGTEAVADAEETEFWQHATNRLRELGYLEMHTLASSYRVVLRIVE